MADIRAANPYGIGLISEVIAQLSNIEVDTKQLRTYANQIHYTRGKLYDIHQQIHNLYLKVGLVDLYNLVKTNIAIKNNLWRLDECEKYLRRTIEEFERTESDLKKIDPTDPAAVMAANVVFTTTSAFDTVFGAFGKKSSSPTISDFLNGDWIDHYFPNCPLWLRESLKEGISDIAEGFFGEEIGSFGEIASKVLDGDYLGALKEVTEKIYKEDGFFNSLGPKFFINSVFGMVEQTNEFLEDPSLENFLSIGWSGTVGSALETTGDAAWGVVKFIPGVSDWYEAHGATDMESAFNTAYTEWARTIFGDDMAEYCGSYYANHGGLFGGLWYGFGEIKKEVSASVKKHGGWIGCWCSGWNSIFS